MPFASTLAVVLPELSLEEACTTVVVPPVAPPPSAPLAARAPMVAAPPSTTALIISAASERRPGRRPGRALGGGVRPEIDEPRSSKPGGGGVGAVGMEAFLSMKSCARGYDFINAHNLQDGLSVTAGFAKEDRAMESASSDDPCR